MRILLAAYNVLKGAQGADQCPNADSVADADADADPDLVMDLNPDDPAF